MPSIERLPCPGKLRLVLFDMDGCLYPSSPELDAVYPLAARALLARHLGVPVEEAARLLEAEKERVAARIQGRPTNTLALLGAWPAIGFDELEAEVNARIEIDAHVRPDGRAVEAVRRVAAVLPVFLYTTNNGRTAEAILVRLGMEAFFPPERRFTTSHVGRLDLPRDQQMAHVKPGLRGFRHILELQGVSPADAMMVGDSEISDMRPARTLGMGAYRITRPEDLHALPDWLGLPDE